ASLFTLVENAQVAIWAYALLGGLAWTTPNYNFQPDEQTPLATIENGLASNNDVEVKEGDRVWDASGSPVELKSGVQVQDATGKVVEFGGTPATMKQLVVDYVFDERLTWSDGEPVKQADYELAYKINCNRESGATTFITCDQVQDVEFKSNGLHVTYLPGVQTPTYFAATLPFGFYPAHRVLSDGRKLADVPASEWATLPEIAESPIDVGPYILKEWVKGEKMVFEANSHYYKGAPKTQNIVIAFITPENAEAQLIGGQVDVLDFTTLVGVTESLKNAADAGQIKLLVNASGSWEHIDMNLFLP
ncbi:MAG: ABC transporter substrate-binding protein, partial [Anaerolineales bacterium]